MTSLVILFVCIILGSALLSLVEAAFLSLPMLRARLLIEKKCRNSKELFYIKENIHVTIASIVIVNNAVNISGSIFIGQKVVTLFGDQWLGIAAFCLTFLVIALGEVLPKTIGERHKIPISLFFAKPVVVLVWILRPLVAVILRMESPLKKKYQLPVPKVTEEEIKIMLKLGRNAGTVEIDEEMLCNRVFKLNDKIASQMMRPIHQIFALKSDKTLGDVKAEIINSRYSRIAVYEKDPMDFVGVVQQRVLLREIAKDNYRARIKDFIVKPIFVHQGTKADALLEKFQAYHMHLFIVQDDEGKDVGLITMEDVLEELFGEIYDEKDFKPKTIPATDWTYEI